LLLPSSTVNLSLNLNLGRTNIDIVPYTVKSSIQFRTIHEKSLNYPKDCTFYFNGYDSVDNADKLNIDIITTAANSGTFSKVHINDHYAACGNK